jgi:hypothetical protein
MLQPSVALWVIYDHPTDFPDHFVVRKWNRMGGSTTLAEGLNCWQACSLEEARRFIPPEAINIGRLKQDDPVIVEVWI